MLDQPLTNLTDETCPHCGGYAAAYRDVYSLVGDKRGNERIVRLDYWFCKSTCRSEWVTRSEATP